MRTDVNGIFPVLLSGDNEKRMLTWFMRSVSNFVIIFLAEAEIKLILDNRK